MTTHLLKNGKTITIRPAVVTDAAGILYYSRTLFASTDQVLNTPAEFTMTVAEEERWIESFTQSPDALVILAEYNKQITGLLFFAALPKKKTSHTGEFGVSVHPAFQGQGIGRFLIETLLAWAKANSHIEKVFLQVLHTNHTAIMLYKKLGFTEEGRHIRAIKQLTGEYADVLQMYIDTKSL